MESASKFKKTKNIFGHRQTNHHFKINSIKFNKLVNTLNIESSDSINSNEIECNFCGSNRFIKEIVSEVPHSSKFRLFFVKEFGYIKLYQLRCGKCSTSLKYLIEKNEFQY